MVLGKERGKCLGSDGEREVKKKKKKEGQRAPAGKIQGGSRSTEINLLSQQTTCTNADEIESRKSLRFVMGSS